MKALIWHVHGSWLTSFAAGTDEYLIPVSPIAAGTAGDAPGPGGGRTPPGR